MKPVIRPPAHVADNSRQIGFENTHETLNIRSYWDDDTLCVRRDRTVMGGFEIRLRPGQYLEVNFDQGGYIITVRETDEALALKRMKKGEGKL